MTKTTKKDSFGERLKKLEDLVADLESGKRGLEESLETFEKGVGLAKDLSRQLEDAKAKVEVLVKDQGKLLKKSWEDS
ncbi:MAG: exodeoxyribonuclease VII small subunit [Elusimicrobia bacterium]|nr:exodeoxyribonuclease VII small subunit [Elusimicrobiota bacterium]MDE2314011.1 exodeoxyribonuclease VII small subunit [Elusimicrobiota bacterium]